MSERATPPFRADHVGSLLRPPRLTEARAQRACGAISSDELRRVEDEAITEAVRMQEEVGLRSITDGEFRRAWWHFDFLTGFDNVETRERPLQANFKSTIGAVDSKPLALHVYGRLARSRPIFVDHFKYVKSLVRSGVPKQTMPSPSMLHARGRNEIIDKSVYPEVEEFFDDLARVYREEIADLASAGCRYIQFDEVNFAFLCDPKHREQVRADTGEDPKKLLGSYAKLINSALAGRPRDMAAAIHLCRGNFKSGWGAEGGYEEVAELLFNEVKADAYFLEYDDARSGSFEPLRFLPKGKIAVLGLITTKTGKLESRDDLKRRVEEAAKFAPLDQLALSPQCGFSSSADGNQLTIEDEIAKLRLVCDTAKEIWG